MLFTENESDDKENHVKSYPPSNRAAIMLLNMIVYFLATFYEVLATL